MDDSQTIRYVDMDGAIQEVSGSIIRDLDRYIPEPVQASEGEA